MYKITNFYTITICTKYIQKRERWKGTSTAPDPKSVGKRSKSERITLLL